MSELKTLATCKPTEFVRQTNRIKKSVEKWLTDTDILNIRKRLPALELIPKDAPEEERTAIFNRNKKIAEEQGEVAPTTIMEVFEKEYLELVVPYQFIKAKAEDHGYRDTKVELHFAYKGEAFEVTGVGNGPLSAVKSAIEETTGADASILDYTQHSLGEGSKARAAAYISMRDEKTGKVTFGVGVSSNITRAGIRAVFSALNRLERNS